LAQAEKSISAQQESIVSIHNVLASERNDELLKRIDALESKLPKI
jgi:DNA-directed RNA polymerase subunit H (RpoH/RPB5)